MSKEWEEYQQLKNRPQSGQDMYSEYQAMKGGMGVRSMTPDTAMPDASRVDTGATVPQDPRIAEVQKRLAALPQPYDFFTSMGDTPIPVPLGPGSGMIGVPPGLARYAFPAGSGLVEGATLGMVNPEPIPGESKAARFVGQMAGMALPAEAAARGVGLGVKALAPGLAPAIEGIANPVLKGAANVGMRGAQGAAAGAAYGAAEQGVKVAKQEPLGLKDLVTGQQPEGFSGKDVAVSAGMWGAVDATLSSLGLAGKMIRNALTKGNRQAAMATLNAGLRNGAIPEEAGLTIRRAIENTGDEAVAPVGREGMESAVKGNVQSRIIQTPQRNIRETITPQQAADNTAIQSEVLASERQGNVGFQPSLIPNQQRLGTANPQGRPMPVNMPPRMQPEVSPKMQVQMNRVSEIDPTVPKIEPVVSNSRQVPTSAETLSQPPVASVQGGKGFRIPNNIDRPQTYKDHFGSLPDVDVRKSWDWVKQNTPEPIEVRQDYLRSNLEKIDINESYATTTDHTIPGLVEVTMNRDGSTGIRLVDGWHRASQALQKGEPFYAYPIPVDGKLDIAAVNKYKTKFNIQRPTPPSPVGKAKEGGTKAYSLAGGLAGVEQNDDGTYTFNPTKAAIGMGAGLAAIHFGSKYGQNKSVATERAGAPKVETPQRVPVEPVTTMGRVEGINLNNLNVETKAKGIISREITKLKPELEKIKGGALTDAEVIEAAKTAQALSGGVTRQESLQTEAALLRTRQHLTALAKLEKVTPEFVNSLKIVSEEATARGRALQKLSIDADPELSSLKVEMIKKLNKIGTDVDDIVKAAEGVDFNNAKQATDFYRKFVPPTLMERLDEYRYINLLSSPRTHIVNAFSNMMQATALRPATRLASGVIDNVAAAINKNYERQFYVRQVGSYYKGMLNSVGEASSGALKALKGTKLAERPDLAHIPTGSKIFEKTGMAYIPRMLEAGDVFFRTLVDSGEKEALAYRAMRKGVMPNKEAIAKESADTAAETVFRKPLDPSNETGQGILLSGIDKGTQAVYQLRKVPGVKWFIPFVQTPMNIFKQGIEYSPMGFATLKGSTRKVEQIGKAAVGSLVFAGAGALALEGRTTWAAPRGQKEKAQYYDSGMQPYSIKIGDKWVSYSKLGPIAYPIAMAAALRYYHEDSPNKLTEPEMQKIVKSLGGIAEFFADQSYLEGMQNILEAVKAKESALTEGVTSTVNQLIPLSALQRWVATMMDPIYRNAEKGLSAEAIIERLKAGIPGLSQQVEPYLNPNGEPSVRSNPVGNAFSPVSFRSSDPTIESGYRAMIQRKQEENRRKALGIPALRKPKKLSDD